MADKIELAPDSPQVGEYNADGSIMRYPTFDVLGNPFNQSRPASTRRIGNYFVVLPVAYTRSDVEIVITSKMEEVKVEPLKKVNPYANPTADA